MPTYTSNRIPKARQAAANIRNRRPEDQNRQQSNSTWSTLATVEPKKKLTKEELAQWSKDFHARIQAIQDRDSPPLKFIATFKLRKVTPEAPTPDFIGPVLPPPHVWHRLRREFQARAAAEASKLNPSVPDFVPAAKKSQN